MSSGGLRGRLSFSIFADKKVPVVVHDFGQELIQSCLVGHRGLKATSTSRLARGQAQRPRRRNKEGTYSSLAWAITVVGQILHSFVSEERGGGEGQVDNVKQKTTPADRNGSYSNGPPVCLWAHRVRRASGN